MTLTNDEIIATEKAAFEIWFTGDKDKKLDVDKEGNYLYATAYINYVTWQAACNYMRNNTTQIKEE